MTDLPDRILAAIEQTAKVARAATQGVWHLVPYPGLGGADLENEDHSGFVAYDSGGGGACTLADAAHIAHNGPQATLRRCEADKRTVERHSEHGRVVQLNGDFKDYCARCDHLFPCPDLLDRADAYDVEAS